MACKVSNVNNTESFYQLKRKLALYSSNHDLGKETVDFSEMFFYSYTSMFFHINWSSTDSSAKELYLREPWKAAHK